MVEVRSGASAVEIEGIVAEAIGALGYFHPKSLTFVAARIARLWGSTIQAFENDGERIKPIPERPRYQVAGEVWGCLSAKGRSNPSYACKATLLRVTFNIRRAAQLAEEPHWRTFATSAQLFCHDEHACSAAVAGKGTVIRLSKRTLGLFQRPVPLPELPARGCDADWCSCRWDFIGDD